MMAIVLLFLIVGAVRKVPVYECFIDGAKKRGTKVKKILTPDSRQIDSRRFKWTDSGAMRHIPPNWV